MAKKATGTEATKTTKSLDLTQFLGEIEKKAFEIYQDRVNKNTPGDSLSDWLKAEEAVRKKHNI